MKSNHLIYTVILLLTLFISCQKKISFDSDLISSKMVVNGFIEPDSVINILVATSKPIPGVVSDFIWLENATAVLFEDGVEIETLETYDLVYNETENNDYWYGDTAEKRPKKGYRSKLKVSAEKTYRLEVSHPDYDDVYCETIIPKPIEILSIDTTTVYTNEQNWEQEQLNVKLKFKDPENEDNYYRLVAFVTKGEVSIEYYDKEVMDTIVYISETYLRIDDPIINPEQEEANDILFSAPSNVYSVFTDELINGKEYTVNFDLSLKDNYYYGNEMETEFDPISMGQFYELKIVLQAISRESYLYIKSSYEHKYYDGELFVEPVQVFSNIENGIGIFAGQSSTIKIYSEGQYPIDGVDYREGYNQGYYDYY
ncbi:MAG: DUF4249 domain-containing protein [Prolixibacteraceae bacterium]|jgi:hypothetical protein|nr:DUF4249 domain-containing protein [Prolixibacteraceae bacterium]